MKVLLFMAMSANGYIARKNGEEDFLSHKNWDTFSRLAEKYHNIIVGRKTYEIVKNWNEDYGFDDFDKATKIVLSKSNYALPEGYNIARSPLEALDKVKKAGFDTALVIGGSTINSTFAKEKLLDEIILNVEPIVIGAGIPLFASGEFEMKLKLVNEKVLEDSGIIQLHYLVEK